MAADSDSKQQPSPDLPTATTLTPNPAQHATDRLRLIACKFLINVKPFFPSIYLFFLLSLAFFLIFFTSYLIIRFPTIQKTYAKVDS